MFMMNKQEMRKWRRAVMSQISNNNTTVINTVRPKSLRRPAKTPRPWLCYQSGHNRNTTLLSPTPAQRSSAKKKSEHESQKHPQMLHSIRNSSYLRVYPAGPAQNPETFPPTSVQLSVSTVCKHYELNIETLRHFPAEFVSTETGILIHNIIFSSHRTISTVLSRHKFEN